ncbi:hypothetical protein VB152_20445, partial [Xanthomonas fragariae]|nr:hypothetical protein [Xanthomonas fragariae]MEA5251620.1 hypothetical protein [Xanthomonas fragariae]
MGGNCKKPAFSVANTGSSGTPVQTSRPCGRWVVGVFQGRLNNQAINHGDGEQSSGEEVAKPKEKLGRIPDDQGVAACAATTTG